MTDHDPEGTDDKPTPQVANLRSGATVDNPGRYNQPTYPPNWGYQPGHWTDARAWSSRASRP